MIYSWWGQRMWLAQSKQKKTKPGPPRNATLRYLLLLLLVLLIVAIVITIVLLLIGIVAFPILGRSSCIIVHVVLIIVARIAAYSTAIQSGPEQAVGVCHVAVVKFLGLLKLYIRTNI